MTLDPEKVAEAVVMTAHLTDDAIVKLRLIAREWLAGTEIRWCTKHEQAWMTHDLEGLEHCTAGMWIEDQSRWNCNIVPARLVGVEK